MRNSSAIAQAFEFEDIIMNAEQIIVLDEGWIIGKGTHDQLLETCETYKEIAISQLELEDLS